MLCGVGLKNTPIKHKNKKGDLVVCVFFLNKKAPIYQAQTKTQKHNHKILHASTILLAIFANHIRDAVIYVLAEFVR